MAVPGRGGGGVPDVSVGEVRLALLSRVIGGSVCAVVSSGGEAILGNLFLPF